MAFLALVRALPSRLYWRSLHVKVEGEDAYINPQNSTCFSFLSSFIYNCKRPQPGPSTWKKLHVHSLYPKAAYRSWAVIAAACDGGARAFIVVENIQELMARRSGLCTQIEYYGRVQVFHLTKNNYQASFFIKEACHSIYQAYYSINQASCFIKHLQHGSSDIDLQRFDSIVSLLRSAPPRSRTVHPQPPDPATPRPHATSRNVL
jgi:hypothetical protein